MSANTVHLIGHYRTDEAIAIGECSPGDLLEVDSDGKVKVHATEGGFAEKILANEDALQGDGLDDDYAIAALVQYLIEESGNVVQMYLKAGQTATVGCRLISAGDGTLKLESDATSAGVVKQIIGWAQEAVDLSTSGAVDTLMDVRLA